MAEQRQGVVRAAAGLQVALLLVGVLLAIYLGKQVVEGLFGRSSARSATVSTSSCRTGRCRRSRRAVLWPSTTMSLSRSSSTFAAMDQVRSVVVADLTIRVPVDGFAPKLGCPGRQVIESVDTAPRVASGDGDAAVIMILEATLFADNQIEIPISSLREGSGFLEAVAPVSLPLLQSATFLDRYQATSNIDVRLSSNLWNAATAQSGCDGSSVRARDLPFRVAALDSMEGYSVQSLDTSDSSLVFPPLTLDIERSASSRRFVYAMLLVPLLLLGAAVATVMRQGQSTDAEPSTFSLELAFGVLSLIALSKRPRAQRCTRSDTGRLDPWS